MSVADALEAAVKAKIGKLENATHQAVNFIAASAREHHIPGRNGGVHALGGQSIRESISGEVHRSGDTFEGKITCKSPHGIYVEFGTGSVGAASGGNGSRARVSYTTRPGWVYPVQGYDDTEFYYTEGQPAKPFMYPAFEDGKAVLKGIIENALK